MLVSALVGATVNVITTYIAAKATGQDYTWTDLGVAALSGAVNAIPYVGPLLAGAISGGYAGYMSYQNGATVEEAVFCGTVSGVLTMASIGNLTTKAFKSQLSVLTAGFVDLIFGTGYNTISSATYKSVIDDSNFLAHSIESSDAGLSGNGSEVLRGRITNSLCTISLR